MSSFVPELEAFLQQRLAERPQGSYSVTVMDDARLAQRKLMEEAMEVCLELQRDAIDADLLAGEAADVVFHLLCGLVGAGVPWSAVEDALRARHS